MGSVRDIVCAGGDKPRRYVLGKDKPRRYVFGKDKPRLYLLGKDSSVEAGFIPARELDCIDDDCSRKN